jgi:hypothetical protein
VIRLLPLLAVLGVASCAGSPLPSKPELLGYGTPAVTSYVPADQAGSVQAMQARCTGVPSAGPSATQGLSAACDQLRRTIHNQPGNEARPVGAQAP